MSEATNGRRMLVVGASAGIGAAVGRLAAEDGWHVALSARRRERLVPRPPGDPGRRGQHHGRRVRLLVGRRGARGRHRALVGVRRARIGLPIQPEDVARTILHTLDCAAHVDDVAVLDHEPRPS